MRHTRLLHPEQFLPSAIALLAPVSVATFMRPAAQQTICICYRRACVQDMTIFERILWRKSAGISGDATCNGGHEASSLVVWFVVVHSCITMFRLLLLIRLELAEVDTLQIEKG